MHGLALGRHHNARQVVAASRRPAPADPLFRIDSETDRRVAVVHPFLLSRLRVPCSSASGKGRCRVCVLCNYQHTPIRIYHILYLCIPKLFPQEATFPPAFGRQIAAPMHPSVHCSGGFLEPSFLALILFLRPPHRDPIVLSLSGLSFRLAFFFSVT